MTMIEAQKLETAGTARFNVGLDLARLESVRGTVEKLVRCVNVMGVCGSPWVRVGAGLRELLQ